LAANLSSAAPRSTTARAAERWFDEAVHEFHVACTYSNRLLNHYINHILPRLRGKRTVRPGDRTEFDASYRGIALCIGLGRRNTQHRQ
jgi:hypothetical protein